MSSWAGEVATSLGISPRGARLVDVGTGNGSLLAALAEEG